MKQIKTELLLGLTALIWGVAFVAQSVGMDYLGPFTFNCIRNLIGGIVLIPCIFFLDKMNPKVPETKIPITKKITKKLIIGGVCCGICLGLASNLQQVGMMYTTVGKAGFITALYIIIVPVLGIFLRKKVAASVWISVGIATIGMYLLCITENFSIGKGDILMFLCAIIFSIHILVIDHFSTYVDCVRMSCIQFFVCGLISGIGMFLVETPNFASILACWAPLLYAGVLSSGVAYTLQIIAQKDTDPTIASLILSLESVFALIGGWIILGQTLDLKELIGCGLVFIAILLAQLPKRSILEQKKETFISD
ncbi:MAG: DMT family transporter [Lachnospiraceae bacterium]